MRTLVQIAAAAGIWVAVGTLVFVLHHINPTWDWGTVIIGGLYFTAVTMYLCYITWLIAEAITDWLYKAK